MEKQEYRSINKEVTIKPGVGDFDIRVSFVSLLEPRKVIPMITLACLISW